MNFQKIAVPLVGLVLVAAAWEAYGWGGVVVAIGGIVMFLLLHFTRMMKIFQRAAETPIGHVASAVMLNAKLRRRMSLLHVIAMTRSFGAPQSPQDRQPEFFRWSDASESHVTCEFQNGKLVQWQLWRPDAPLDADAPAPDQSSIQSSPS